jgi:hypothetical protein
MKSEQVGEAAQCDNFSRARALCSCSMTNLLVILFALAAMLGIPATAQAWGCEGHQVIALLAEQNLTPRALATAKRILAARPIDPALDRWCKQGGDDPMADASSWADDIRNSRPETAPWHYIDIPDGVARQDLAKFCSAPRSCVTQAIRDELTILRNSANAPDEDPQKTAEALRFVIHFVGDLHQPMHAISNNDLGGNCVPVAYFDTQPVLKNPKTDSYSPNLHSVWDFDLLDRIFPGQSVEQVATRLTREFDSKFDAWEKTNVDFDAWAWESHQAAIETAYGKLPVAIPVEAPAHVKSCVDDDRVSQRRLKLNEQLLQPYQDASVPLIEERLAMAGTRLAMLLNQLWP